MLQLPCTEPSWKRTASLLGPFRSVWVFLVGEGRRGEIPTSVLVGVEVSAWKFYFKFRTQSLKFSFMAITKLQIGPRV